MNKVICDICGTSYPETSAQCPICGYSRELGQFLLEDPQPASQEGGSSRSTGARGGRFSNTRRREESADYPGQEEPAYSNEYDEQPRRSNPLLVTLLVVMILAMLTVTGFLFLRFFLPNVGREETQPSTLEETTEPPTQETMEEITEEPTVPCESLVLLNEPEVTLEGLRQYYLIHVEFAPADTTDKVEYTSSDEAIAVVNGEGRVEVTGEGIVTVTVTCGEKQVDCVLTCLPEPEETMEETTEETTEETQGETQEETKAKPEIVLYLDKTDFTLSFRGDFYQLNFNPELSAEDIAWISANPSVATVENGRVTCISFGTTKITARYGDQEVSCVVRCVW